MQNKLRLITRSVPVAAWSLLLMTLLSFVVFQYKSKLQMASYLQIEPLEKCVSETQYSLSKGSLHVEKYIHGDRGVSREHIFSFITLARQHADEALSQTRQSFQANGQISTPDPNSLYMKFLRLKTLIQFFEDMAVQRVDNPVEMANMLNREHHKLYVEADDILDEIAKQLRLKKKRLERQQNNLGNGLMVAWVLFAFGIGFFTIRIERKEGEYERRLSRSEAYLRSLFATLPDPVLVVNAEGVILDVPSPNPELLTGAANELKEQSIACLVGADKLENALEHIAQAFEKKSMVTFEYEQDAGQKRRIFEGRIIAIPGSRLPSALWVAHDLTGVRQTQEHRLELERRIHQTLRQESLGLMAGGIAHDFDNLLTGVMGHAEIALMQVDEKDDAHDSIKHIHQAACRAAELATQMLKYSGNKHMAFDRVDLNRLVLDIQEEFKDKLSEMVDMTVVCGSEAAFFEGDAEQIRQVVRNVTINAVEAIKDHVGGITIYTGIRTYSEQELKDNYLKESYAGGEYVSFKVEDTGCGIAPEDFDRLFDPFFTTKFTGRGLGLAVVLGIVRSHKGVIRVKSFPGTGTSFEVLFPCEKIAGTGDHPDFSGVL